ncbi:MULTISPECIES: HU family DNA-binding protein [unclassified Mesorhizobium]|uniref:HU family DNA-binding protein n=1 Tax=Mesorhizobium sp. B1-1-6 TaxID=2589978 RepID=UPI00112A1EB0|nr:MULTISPECIES: HU family DNA-binding protein [unclassified Mesorhizobium]MBZ9898288.1 HU family DNA-binding protein [Mesorhizobium sp. BR1-1-6]TPN30284.1 hypothetical protein FJ979_30935 [Mesorhizobium sp. B1-1-6]
MASSRRLPTPPRVQGEGGAEREGRNPSTGAATKIAASKKLTFTPAKDALNG